jgi:hypothetical protein
LRPRFEVGGAVVRASWTWLGLPAVMAIVAVALLANDNVLGLVPQMIAVTALGIGIVRRPRRHVPARIKLDGDVVLIDDLGVARMRDIVGISVLATGLAAKQETGRLVSLSIRGRAPLDLVLGSDSHVAELRAAIGLVLARSASRRFHAQAPLGCMTSVLAAMTGLFAAIMLVSNVGSSNLLLLGMLAPVLLVGSPLLFGRLKQVVITCGEEGIHVKRLFGARLVKYFDVESINSTFGSIVSIQTGELRLSFELPSTEDALGLVEDVRQRAAMPAPDGEANVAALLARGERSMPEWLEAVRKQASPRTEGYRSLHLAEDRLWAVLEDPSADPTARVAAAVALRAQSQARVPELEQRVRVAASTTAFPEIRIALEEVADAPDDEQVAARVMRVLS